MNRTLFVVVVIFLIQSPSLAQSQEVPKFEVAGEFTTLEREGFSNAEPSRDSAPDSLTTSTRFSASRRQVISCRRNVFNAATPERSRKVSRA